MKMKRKQKILKNENRDLENKTKKLEAKKEKIKKIKKALELCGFDERKKLLKLNLLKECLL